jgi:lambda family phage tail tape measure protein
MTGSLTPGGLFAKGGAFTNSIVSSPTMFKFADGGAMRTGLMGEAGPEAIMPLKRGADGSSAYKPTACARRWIASKAAAAAAQCLT